MNYKDISLSEISCYAAGEIDNYILNRNKELDATDELAFRMKKFSKEKLIEINPTEALIYQEILKQDKNIKTVKDLQFKIHLLSEDLNSVKTSSKEKLESLRTLCLNISKEAVVYENYHPDYLVA